MRWRKPRTTLITFCLASLLGLFLSGLPMRVLAQQLLPQVQGQPGRTQPPTGLALHILQAQVPKLPPRRLPGRREPAAGRGCEFDLPQIPLTALIPETNLGLTIAAYPTFFFYIPQTSAQELRFVLLDEEKGNQVYKTTFTPPTTPGIVSLSLPSNKNLPPLEVGKTYHWYFQINCSAQQLEQDIGNVYVDGWVQRLEPSLTLTSQLEKASPRKRVELYRNNDLWYDALTTLAEQRRLKPNDFAIATEWENLLGSGGLNKEIARKPIVGS